MDPIGTIVRTARRRIMMRDALSRAASASVIAGVSLLPILLAARLSSGWVPSLGSPFIMWTGAGLAVLSVVAWTLLGLSRPSDIAVASVVDVRLGLHDRLSTAIAVASRADPFARAAIEDGIRAAQDRRVHDGLRVACPVPLSGRACVGPGLMAAAMAAWMILPPIPVGGADAPSSDRQEELASARAAAAARLEPVVRQIESNEALSKALGMDEQQEGELVGAGRDGESAETVRKEAARRMTELTQRLDQLMQSEQAQQLDALKDALSRVEPQQGSPVQALAEALKRGDAATARQRLDQLAKQAADPELDAATRESLAKSIEQLAAQIEKSAASQDGLKKALERSGMDPALASNPAALEQALAKSEQLNEAQKESVRQAARAQRSANESLEKLAKSMGQCAGQCRNPSASQSGGQSGSQGQQSQGQEGSKESSSASSLAQGSQMLSEMEQLAQMMQDAQSARSQCAGGGQGTQLANASSASRSGRAGQGRGPQGGPSNGGSTPTEETPFGTKSRKEKVANQGGDVIARQLVDAPPVVGESRAKLKQIAQEISRGVEEGTGEDPVPPHLREAHRRYFGEMRRRIEQKTGPASP
jgi:hypothetical protein